MSSSHILWSAGVKQNMYSKLHYANLWLTNNNYQLGKCRNVWRRTNSWQTFWHISHVVWCSLTDVTASKQLKLFKLSNVEPGYEFHCSRGSDVLPNGYSALMYLGYCFIVLSQNVVSASPWYLDRTYIDFSTIMQSPYVYYICKIGIFAQNHILQNIIMVCHMSTKVTYMVWWRWSSS